MTIRVMHSENLLCGAQLICSGNKAEIRNRNGVVAYRGTYRQVKAEAKRRGLLTSQAPYRGSVI